MESTNYELWVKARDMTAEYAGVTREVLELVKKAESVGALPDDVTSATMERLLVVLDVMGKSYESMVAVNWDGDPRPTAKPSYDRYKPPPRGGNRPA